MRKGFLGALLALSLVGTAGAEVIRNDATIFNPDGPKLNQMQDIPSAHKLSSDQQVKKVALTMTGSLPGYLENAKNLDGAVHKASDFTATSGTRLSSNVQAQAAFSAGGKKVPSSNKLNPIKL